MKQFKQPSARLDPKEGLPVDDAIAQLSHLATGTDAPLRLVLPYESGVALAGATPFKPLLGFTQGVNFDHGKVFLEVGARMRAPSAELAREAETLQRSVNALGAIGLILRNRGATDEDKLRAIGQHVAAFSTHNQEDR